MSFTSVQTVSSSSPSQLCITQPKPTVYIIDQFHPDAIEHAKGLFNIVLPEDEAFQGWRNNASAILMRGSHITADDVASCPNLIAIGKHGVGIDNIDQDACNARGIRILNTPGANARDVAELVLALTLAVARDIRSVTTRQMTTPIHKQNCNGLTMYRKTIGIIGMGNIGSTVAEIFHSAFKADLVAYDPYVSESVWPDLPHHRARSVDEVVTRSDVVTIHASLTKETRNMINYRELRMMKPDAILINAARGGIVNEKDLETILSEGHLWGAGIDCHELEPPTKDRYGTLWESLNVISTPHIGAATANAQRTSAMAAVNNLYNYLSTL